MRLRGRKSVVAALVVPTIYWRIAATAAAQTNIAPDGTGYVWHTMTTAIATTGQTAAPGINNRNLTTAGQRNRMEHGLSHSPTGCMSQYNLAPHAGPSPLNIGTMAFDSWFDGAIGKVAIYNCLLTPTQITNHYKAMTGKQPTGSCASTCTF